MKMARDLKVDDKITPHSSLQDLCKSLQAESKPHIIIFSIPHGGAGDEVLQSVRPYLRPGDLILDCSNEHFSNTERRQKSLEPDGIHYVGCGVSGGYQSARAGPSLSPGGSRDALEIVLPVLRDVAARDSNDEPCTGPIGPGGSGHYVKMVHNGIEQGMMAIIAEAWYLLTQGLDLDYDQTGQVLKEWNQSDELKNCFLVHIGADVNRERDAQGQHPLGYVQDKVVQDVDESEGTGTWTCEEAVRLHSPAATILSAHLLRCASADLGKRRGYAEASRSHVVPKVLHVKDRIAFVEQLKQTVYFCFTTCFIQGLSIIRKTDAQRGWNINYPQLLRIWGNGTIIQAGHIISELRRVCGRTPQEQDTLLADNGLNDTLNSRIGAVREVVISAVGADMVIPAISQSLEYYKYMVSTDLPTQFMEAELDYFGNHHFDIKGHGNLEPVKGRHHFEWQRALGQLDI